MIPVINSEGFFGVFTDRFSWTMLVGKGSFLPAESVVVSAAEARSRGGLGKMSATLPDGSGTQVKPLSTK